MNLCSNRTAGVLLLLLSLPAGAAAHPLSPASYRLQVEPDGKGELRWRTPASAPVGTDVRPALPASCKAIGHAQIDTDEANAAVTVVQGVQCDPAQLAGSTIAFAGAETGNRNVVVQVLMPDGRGLGGLVSADSPTFVIPEKESFAATFLAYTKLGIKHLLSGFDHVLFVIGLLALIGCNRRLFWAVTAFTLGHSVTLALSVFSVIRLPSAIVEVAIAITIIVVALEIGEAKQSAVQRRPWLWPALFGLLHGLGFASVLTETGMSEASVPLSLFSFNVGIELAQLFVLLVAALVVFVVPRVVAIRSSMAIQICAYSLGGMGAYYVIQRTAEIFF